MAELRLIAPAYVFELRQIIAEGGVMCSVCNTTKRALILENDTLTCIKCWIETREKKETKGDEDGKE